MTQEQKTELEYLIDLLREASKWNVDQGDDALRLEVDLRINNILNSVEVEGDAEPEVSPEPNEDLESPENREKWKADKVRCQENGKVVWRPLSQCHKEKLFPNNPKAKKFRWVWDGPQDKKAQEEEQMWAEHEQGE